MSGQQDRLKVRISEPLTPCTKVDMSWWASYIFISDIHNGDFVTELPSEMQQADSLIDTIDSYWHEDFHDNCIN